MFNLIRMDLYRIIRSKAVYVCLGILIATTIACYGLLYLMATPEGQKTAVAIGMLTDEADDLEEAGHVLDGVDSLVFFRQISLDGGLYNVVFGIVIALFLGIDFQSGYIKNIMVLHKNRTKYILGKLVTAGLINFFYLLVAYALNALMNRLFHTLVPYAGLKDSLFYLSWAWLLTMAFAALVIAVSVVTKNTTAAVTTAVLFGSGIVTLPIASVMDWFHLGGWFKYTIYYNMNHAPNVYSSVGDLRVYVIAIVFFMIYFLTGAVSISRQDI